MNEKRKQYHSIPLRKRAVGNTTGEVHHLRSHSGSYEKRVSMPDREQAYIGPMPTFQPDGEQRCLPTRVPNSTRRYTNVHGHEVFEQGNQRLVVHRKSKLHWLLFVGLGMVIALLLFVLAQWVWASIQEHNTEVQYAQYGYPRTWQTDAVVGHGDSALHPSHFIFENLKGHVLVIELPAGDITRAIIYSGPTIYSDQADQFPVTGSFQDVNGDGRPDMELHINGQTITFLNNGSKFVPPSQ